MPEQFMRPPSQGAPEWQIPPPSVPQPRHALAEQIVRPMHAMPHALQLLSSLVRSRHVPEQFVAPPVHGVAPAHAT